ncbi:hypothetical protein C8T65DRAFT_593923 [Cerioporus squamosus]|nr:hypothetical protein C8T65DRAFT_593923 [Cerioporus squamosus]
MAFDININRRLAHFFTDPLAFRSLQARTGTVISGSFALSFFERSELPPSGGLDIVLHMRHRREVGRWLLQAGYHFVPDSHQHPDFEVTVFNPISLAPGGLVALDGIASVLTFEKVSSRPPVKTTVKLIVAESAPMEVILSSHSTCVMNVISYEAAYCLFPYATLEKRITLLSSSTKGVYRKRGEELLKYASRGFDIILAAPANSAGFDAPRSAFAPGWRWLDDNLSWVVRLDTFGVALPRNLNRHSEPVLHDPVAISNWYMRYNRGKGAVMQFGIVKSDLLGYRYLIGDQDLIAHLSRYLASKLQAEQERLGGKAEEWALYDRDLRVVCMQFVRDMGARRMSCMREIC